MASNHSEGKKSPSIHTKKEGFSSNKPEPEKETLPPEEEAKKILSSMTAEQKAGQIMMVGIRGKEAAGDAADFINNRSAGGIILFDRNMESPGQVAELTNSLQNAAKKSPLSLPLMISVDQEGGMVTRMKEKVSPIPSQQQLGHTSTAADVYDVANLNGKELSAMGITINLAPVLDLSSTDTRSFGENPEKTYEYGTSSIKGLNDAGITGALKHFPGNGRSQVDPHKDSSAVEADQLDLENSDIYPFKRIIAETDNQNFFTLVTHIKYPAYDKEKPASLSPVIIKDLLRKKLGFEGIVVTDDLEMGAVNKYYTYKDMGVEAVNAGADLLLVCHEYKNQVEVYDGIVAAIKSGKIKQERIDEAVKRILIYKLSSNEPEEADPQRAEALVGNKASRDFLNGL